MPTSFQNLIADHDDIEAMIINLHDLAGCPDVRHDDIARELNILADRVERHLEVEDSTIYPLIMKLHRQTAPSDAAVLESSFAHLKNDWSEYVQRWTSRMIADDREGFSGASQSMLERLRERVRLETELLYTAALRASYIRLRSGHV